MDAHIILLYAREIPSKDSSRKLVLLPRYGNVVFVLRQYCLSATATLF
ncbi:hypothetical protein HMPREF0673_02789 [Leyella stercorea DSM 18206]|uniref:Uncharacterized protein n=1 Tax=Leyella stercorea DSM 18206 TaxID=1002367 RepID=G6B1L4_9BACT|nr:hypothetical protein HMPREF0673_02789 [Leyella stercorea DSM 18206]